MKNRIDSMFENLRARGKKALVTFLTFGDPNVEVSKSLVLEMEKSGADLIEMGIPFSDPMAEGPVIQEANIRALKNEINLDIIFEAVSELRKSTQVPLVFLMYFNSLLSYGIDEFFNGCKKAGVDGVIIPDLPFEESDEIYDYTQKYGVYQISMIAPTSSEERSKRICERACGFLYCVSSMGVTGVREGFSTDFDKMFDMLNKYSDIPKCIGFGISKPEHIRNLKKYCDGLIVGSAIVRIIAAGETVQDKIDGVSALTKELSDAAKE